jgi:hypothetical protein
MRRTLLICAVLLFGCAKSEPPPSDNTTGEMSAISLADVAGTWEGTVTAAGNDSALALIELTAAAEPTGWTMKVANAKTPSTQTVVPSLSVVAAGDSVIVDAGPFQSVLRAGQQVTTHAVYRLQEGKLVGTIQATYPESGETVMLHSVSTRKAG